MMTKNLIIAIVALPTAAFLIFVFYQLKKLAKNTKVVDYDEINSQGQISYSCPKCGVEMKRGFIVAGRGIVWRNETEKPKSIFTAIHKSLGNTINLTMSVKENRAWKCDNCKYVLIDHSTLVGKIKKPLKTHST